MIFLLLLLQWATPENRAETPVVVEPVFSDEVCEDYLQIAKDYVELELLGLRWQGGEPSCLKSVQVKSLLSERAISIGDPGLLDPELLLPRDRMVSVQVKRVPQDLLEVRFSYIGKKGSQDIPVKDFAILKLNFNRTRDLKGCASLYQAPSHFVMRKGCNRD
jgi:hypothetical protein